MLAKMLRMNSCVEEKGLDIRIKRIEKIASESRLLSFVKPKPTLQVRQC